MPLTFIVQSIKILKEQAIKIKEIKNESNINNNKNNDSEKNNVDDKDDKDEKDDNEKKEFDFIENGIYVILILGINVLVIFSCLLYAIISKCTKSKVDPTIMIESFSKNNEDLKTNSEENVIK